MDNHGNHHHNGSCYIHFGCTADASVHPKLRSQSQPQPKMGSISHVDNDQPAASLVQQREGGHF